MNILSTTQKAERLISMKSALWFGNKLDITQPTLRSRLKGVYPWRFPEEALIDDLYDRAEVIIKLEEQIDSLQAEYKIKLDAL